LDLNNSLTVPGRGLFLTFKLIHMNWTPPKGIKLPTTSIGHTSACIIQQIIWPSGNISMYSFSDEDEAELDEDNTVAIFIVNPKQNG
jgi:hypothetical protein